jgi:dTDP-4-amino-4,6-dideoxygalactose transaminase
MPVHLYGQPCRMPEILAFATQHGLAVVEDNAQDQGATYEEQRTGSFGVANATSFYPTKNLGALGDAGAITTYDAALAEQLRRHPQKPLRAARLQLPPQPATVARHDGSYGSNGSTSGASVLPRIN